MKSKIVVSVVFLAILLLLLAEMISRVAYRIYCRLPFRDRRIAEYPYGRFLVQVPAPVHCVMKKGFRSEKINVNRFGLRGAEPADNGLKRRILVVGESNFFGAKLLDERHIWADVLESVLKRNGHADWEVLNGGTPLYASAQHWHFWADALGDVKPEILVVCMGGNDVAQMTVLGERWTPEAHWPYEFLLKLERKSTWWNSFLSRFCLYFFYRRIFEGPPAARFAKGEGEMQWEACRRNILAQYRNFAAYAGSNTIKIVFATAPTAYHVPTSKENERRLWAIQSTYRDSITRDRPYFTDLNKAVSQDLCRELGIPYWDLQADFASHPNHFSAWYDMLHWNEIGMEIVARSLYDFIDRHGWWS